MTGPRILIVDDNAANVKVAKYALESEGYQVWTASDAEEAVDRLYEVQPVLILMDIQLPGMDGLELTRMLKSRPATKDIVIVAVTAYAMMGDRERALSAGCDGYITKPLDPISLPAQLAEYMAETGRTGNVVAAQEAAQAFFQHSKTVSHHTAFPRHSAPSDARPMPDGSKQIILVVEDNPATCRMYRLTLETAGYEVLEARDGRTALETLNLVTPALILQDLVLPDMNGVELARMMREKLGAAPLPILCVSGFLSPMDEESVANSAFTETLVKPLDPYRLLAALKTHLTPPPSLGEPAGNGRLLIVVDDDSLQRRLAHMWFSSAGFEVIAVGGGAEAFNAAKTRHAAAIVSDVLMPGMDGFALCLKLRNDPELAHIPVILTSSHYTEPEDRDLARRVGAAALLPKEGGLENVTRAVAAALDEASHPIVGDALGKIQEEHSRRRAAQLERQVLENTSLLRRTVLHQAQLAVLAGVADSLSKNVLADAVLGDVLGACLDMAGVSRGALYVRRGEKTLELMHQIGFSEAENIRLRAQLGHSELFAQAITLGSVIALPSNGINFGSAQEMMIDAGVTSLLLVPITSGMRTSGLMLFGARTADVSDQSAQDFGRVLGSLMGQALTLTQAFEKLGASELRYRTLTENANDAICILTPEGLVREVNHRVTEITGYPAEYFIGKGMRDFATPVHSAENLPQFSSENGDLAGSARRYQVQKKDGGVALIDFSNARIGIDGESVVFSIGRDVTEQVRAQAQLMVSDRLVSLGMLAAGLAHEVNNPLAVLLGNLELAAEDVEKLANGHRDSQAAKSLRSALCMANEAGDRIKSIVRDLKIFSRADKSDESFRNPVDLKVLLQSTLRMAENETRHRARLIESYGTDATVDANESRLGQVFLNLIMNAAQAIPEGRADVNHIRVGDEPGRVRKGGCRDFR